MIRSSSWAARVFLLCLFFIPVSAVAQSSAPTDAPVIVVQNTKRLFVVTVADVERKNAAAYEALDRPDLAKNYRRRRRAKPFAVLIGGAITFVALNSLAAGAFLQNSSFAKNRRSGYALIGIGLIGVSGGAGLVAWGFTSAPHAYDAVERSRLVRRYNARHAE